MSRSAERIVSLLWLLLEAGAIGRTKSEIFHYLYDHQNTSRAAKQRQFSRDKEALTAIGVPVQWRQQPASEDVYLIDRDRLYLPELELSDAEVMALDQARALWTRTPIEDAIHTALARMTAQQPTRSPVVGAQLATEQHLLTDLVAAARDETPVRFRYRTVGDEKISRRTVRPWAVLMVHQQWYVVGWDLDRGAQRLFRLSRIESKTISPLTSEITNGLDAASQRPVDFDVDAIRRRLDTQHPASDAYVWLSEDIATSLRIRATEVAHRNGWDLVHFTHRDPLKTAARIAALTTDAQVDARSGTELAHLVTNILQLTADSHEGPAGWQVPKLTRVARTRRRASDKEVIARRLGIVAVVNQHGGALSRAQLRTRFSIDDATLTEDLRAMQFWGMPEADFAGGQFDVEPEADPVTIANAELLAQPWQLSAPEALGLISGLGAVTTIPGISPKQQAAAESLDAKLRAAVDAVAPAALGVEPVVHPDLSLGADDEVAEILHRAAHDHRVVTMSYYSESSGSISTRDIEPLQLVYTGGHGYVRAWCQNNHQLRTFRLDRIGSASMTPTTFVPADHRLNPEQISPEVDAASWTVMVRATHRHRDVLTAYHPQATATTDDGALFARLAFRSLDPLLELVTNHPGHIVVLEPMNIREIIWQRARKALDATAETTREPPGQL